MDLDVLDRIVERAAAVGFDAACARGVGELLTVLAASKPGGRILELGTGAGLGTARLLAGMDASASLTTVELDANLSRIAQEEIQDSRVEWVVGDGGDWLARCADAYDLVFADTWPGKFTHLDDALRLVRPGGLYIVDDLLPQPNWPSGHQAAVDDLTTTLRQLPDWTTAYLDACSGLMICTRR